VGAYLSDPPRWLIAVVAGGMFGIAMGLSAKFDGDGWFGAGLMATSGIPFGLTTAWWTSRWRRERDQVEADIPAEKLQATRLAAARGPVPTDPEIRAAAARIAAHELTEVTRHRRLRILLGGVMLIGTVGAAAAGSLWALLYAFVAAAVLYTNWYRPRQLRRRIAQLRATDSSSA
jgi:Flp pilus assembly protein TadB